MDTCVNLPVYVQTKQCIQYSVFFNIISKAVTVFTEGTVNHPVAITEKAVAVAKVASYAIKVLRANCNAASSHNCL